MMKKTRFIFPQILMVGGGLCDMRTRVERRALTRRMKRRWQRPHKKPEFSPSWEATWAWFGKCRHEDYTWKHVRKRYRAKTRQEKRISD